MLRRIVALAAVGGLGAALPILGVSANASAPRTPATAGGPAAPRIEFGPCRDAVLDQAGAECGFVPVPLDYDHPGGKKIRIRVSRVEATSAPDQREGAILVNPGGPGGSGLIFPAILPQAVPGGVGGRYDWIGFDPRGVGASRPAVSCEPDYFAGPRPNPRPDPGKPINGDEREWVDRSTRYAQDCVDNNGPIVEHMTSPDTVRDMDRIRAALGEKQINYYGFSYGTYLGQLYSTMYPDRIRRIVLDGNVPPDYPGYGDGGRAQTESFERVINEFFAWAASYDDVYGLGDTGEEVRSAYDEQLAKLEKQPVNAIGPTEWAETFLVAGYTEFVWPRTADALADWLAGDTSTIESLYQATASVGDDNGYAAFNSTLCTDGTWPHNYRKVRREARDLYKSAPFLTWSSFWYSGPCTFWQVPSATPVEIDGQAIPALLINATLDGATPFAGALAVRRQFPESALVAEVGATTHAGSLQGNDCVDGAIARYLADGSLPDRDRGDGADLKCAAKPKPVPDPVDRSRPAAQVGLLNQLTGGIVPPLFGGL